MEQEPEARSPFVLLVWALHAVRRTVAVVQRADRVDRESSLLSGTSWSGVLDRLRADLRVVERALERCVERADQTTTQRTLSEQEASLLDLANEVLLEGHPLAGNSRPQLVLAFQECAPLMALLAGDSFEVVAHAFERQLRPRFDGCGSAKPPNTGALRLRRSRARATRAASIARAKGAAGASLPSHSRSTCAIAAGSKTRQRHLRRSAQAQQGKLVAGGPTIDGAARRPTSAGASSRSAHFVFAAMDVLETRVPSNSTRNRFSPHAIVIRPGERVGPNRRSSGTTASPLESVCTSKTS